MSFPTYFETFDAKQLLADYPVGQAFVDRYTQMSRDELHALQNERFLKLMKRGWEIPFYQRLWGNKGLEPGDIRRLEDIVKLPVYDKSDLMASVNEYPPYGDFDGRGGGRLVAGRTGTEQCRASERLARAMGRRGGDFPQSGVMADRTEQRRLSSLVPGDSGTVGGAVAARCRRAG